MSFRFGSLSLSADRRRNLSVRRGAIAHVRGILGDGRLRGRRPNFLRLTSRDCDALSRAARATYALLLSGTHFHGPLPAEAIFDSRQPVLDGASAGSRATPRRKPETTSSRKTPRGSGCTLSLRRQRLTTRLRQSRGRSFAIRRIRSHASRRGLSQRLSPAQCIAHRATDRAYVSSCGHFEASRSELRQNCYTPFLGCVSC